MSNTTISQALRVIARLKGRMATLSRRADNSVSREVGKQPHFSFAETRKQIGETREQLILLESAVAIANANTVIEVEGRRMTIAEAIRRTQEIKAEIAWLSGLQIKEGVEHVNAGFGWDEVSHRQIPQVREVTYVTDLPEPERVAEVEALTERFDRINDVVETANHVTPIHLLVASAA